MRLSNSPFFTRHEVAPRNVEEFKGKLDQQIGQSRSQQEIELNNTTLPENEDIKIEFLDYFIDFYLNPEPITRERNRPFILDHHLRREALKCSKKPYELQIRQGVDLREAFTAYSNGINLHYPRQLAAPPAPAAELPAPPAPAPAPADLINKDIFVLQFMGTGTPDLNCNYLGTALDDSLQIPACNVFTFSFSYNKCLRGIFKLSKFRTKLSFQKQYTRKESIKESNFLDEATQVVEHLLEQGMKRIYFTGHSYGGMMCHLLLEKLIDNVKKNTTLEAHEFNARIMRIFQTVKIVTFGSIYITSYFIGNYGDIMNNFNTNNERGQNYILQNFIRAHATRHRDAEVPNRVDRDIGSRINNSVHYLPHDPNIKQQAIDYATGEGADRAAQAAREARAPRAAEAARAEEAAPQEAAADRAQAEALAGVEELAEELAGAADRAQAEALAGAEELAGAEAEAEELAGAAAEAARAAAEAEEAEIQGKFVILDLSNPFEARANNYHVTILQEMFGRLGANHVPGSIYFLSDINFGIGIGGGNLPLTVNYYTETDVAFNCLLKPYWKRITSGIITPDIIDQFGPQGFHRDLFHHFILKHMCYRYFLDRPERNVPNFADTYGVTKVPYFRTRHNPRNAYLIGWTKHNAYYINQTFHLELCMNEGFTYIFHRDRQKLEKYRCAFTLFGRQKPHSGYQTYMFMKIRHNFFMKNNGKIGERIAEAAQEAQVARARQPMRDRPLPEIPDVPDRLLGNEPINGLITPPALDVDIDYFDEPDVLGGPAPAAPAAPAGAPPAGAPPAGAAVAAGEPAGGGGKKSNKNKRLHQGGNKNTKSKRKYRQIKSKKKKSKKKGKITSRKNKLKLSGGNKNKKVKSKKQKRNYNILHQGGAPPPSTQLTLEEIEEIEQIAELEAPSYLGSPYFDLKEFYYIEIFMAYQFLIDITKPKISVESYSGTITETIANGIIAQIDLVLGIDSKKSDELDKTDEESEDFQKLEQLYEIIKGKNIPQLIRAATGETESIAILSLIDGARTKANSMPSALISNFNQKSKLEATVSESSGNPKNEGVEVDDNSEKSSLPLDGNQPQEVHNEAIGLNYE